MSSGLRRGINKAIRRFRRRAVLLHLSRALQIKRTTISTKAKNIGNDVKNSPLGKSSKTEIGIKTTPTLNEIRLANMLL
jgi:hypothetical protein